MLPFKPSDQRFDEGFMLVKLRAQNICHGRQVGKQIDEAIQVPTELDDGVLWQRTHQRRPEQPKFRFEEPWGKPVLNELTVQRRFAGERKLRETEAVAKVQPIPLVMHASEVPIDNMGLVDKRVFLIEREELFRDIYIRVSLSGDLREQIPSATELPVEDRA